MIVSACMGLTQRIGGVYEVLYSSVKDRMGDRAIPQPDRAEIEKLPDQSNNKFVYIFSY